MRDPAIRKCRLLAMLLACSCFLTPAVAAVNFAVVIANSAYDGRHWESLPNTRRDADLIYRTLQNAKFKLAPISLNMNFSQLDQQLTELSSQIAMLPSDSIVWIYYAGHGFQINGENYLVPVGAPRVEEVISSTNDASEHALAKVFVPINRVIAILGARTSASVKTANVIVLDACRSNPLDRGPKRSRGLADLPVTSNTLIAYSAAAGRVSDDGPTNGNSPYATAFAKNIVDSYLPLELIFNGIAKDVSDITDGIQRPETRAGLIGYYCIRECMILQPLSDASEKSLSTHQDTTSDLTQGAHRAVDSDEKCDYCLPTARITLATKRQILVGRTVITRAMWRRCVGQTACVNLDLKAPDDSEDFPITGVSWEEVQDFLVWATNMSGRRYRLPTSQEWEEILEEVAPTGLAPRASNKLKAVHAEPGSVATDEGVAEWTSTCESKAAGVPCVGWIVRGRSWRDFDEKPRQSNAYKRSSRGDGIGFRVVSDP